MDGGEKARGLPGTRDAEPSWPQDIHRKAFRWDQGWREGCSSQDTVVNPGIHFAWLLSFCIRAALILCLPPLQLTAPLGPGSSPPSLLSSDYIFCGFLAVYYQLPVSSRLRAHLPTSSLPFLYFLLFGSSDMEKSRVSRDLPKTLHPFWKWR